MAENPNEPERPRAEPEIIPPGRGRRPGDRSPDWPPSFGDGQTRGMHRIYVSRIGPLGFGIIMLVVGTLVALMLLLLIGAALLWIPLLAVIVVAAAISGVLRRL